MEYIRVKLKQLLNESEMELRAIYKKWVASRDLQLEQKLVNILTRRATSEGASYSRRLVGALDGAFDGMYSWEHNGPTSVVKPRNELSWIIYNSVLTDHKDLRGIKVTLQLRYMFDGAVEHRVLTHRSNKLANLEEFTRAVRKLAAEIIPYPAYY